MQCAICDGRPPHTDLPIFSSIQQRNAAENGFKIGFIVTAVTAGALIGAAPYVVGLGLAGAVISGLFQCCMVNLTACNWCEQRCYFQARNVKRSGIVMVGLGVIGIGLTFLPTLTTALCVSGVCLAVFSAVARGFFIRFRPRPLANGDSDTVLTSAIKANSLWRVKFALYFSAYLEQEVQFNGAPCSPLQIAAHFERVEIARILLDRGANPEGHPLSHSPLLIAVDKVSTAMVALLLDKRAKCNALRYVTPFDLAVSNYAKEKQRLILDKQKELQSNGRSLEEIANMEFHIQGYPFDKRKEELRAEGRGQSHLVAISGEEVRKRRRILLLLLTHHPSLDKLSTI